MDIEKKIEQAIAPALSDMGYEIVRVMLMGNEVKTVQVMVERQDRVSMTTEDCSKVSRTTSTLLDLMNLFSGKWILEISSPGIDRPLLKLSDYERFIGYEAKIETATVHEGQRRFKGTIVSVDPSGNIVLATEGLQITLSFSDIIKAKLILNDKLLKQKN